MRVDLGATTPLCQVVLQWQRSCAKAYRVDVSADGVNGWTHNVISYP
ncbi:hypothetical protein [Dactylosporangium sp. CA-233914]